MSISELWSEKELLLDTRCLCQVARIKSIFTVAIKGTVKLLFTKSYKNDKMTIAEL
jgi:hypothetical protein